MSHNLLLFFLAKDKITVRVSSSKLLKKSLSTLRCEVLPCRRFSNSVKLSKNIIDDSVVSSLKRNNCQSPEMFSLMELT